MPGLSEIHDALRRVKAFADEVLAACRIDLRQDEAAVHSHPQRPRRVRRGI